MIRDRDCVPSPPCCRPDQRLRRYNGVHRAHLRMRVKLDTLDLGIILPARYRFFFHARRKNHKIVLIVIKTNIAFDADPAPFFHRPQDACIFLFVPEKNLPRNPLCFIGHIKEKQVRLLERLSFDTRERPDDDDRFHLIPDISNERPLTAHAIAKNTIRGCSIFPFCFAATPFLFSCMRLIRRPRV